MHVNRRGELRTLLMRTRQYVLAAAIVGAITGFAIVGFERLVVDVIFDRVLVPLPLAVLAFVPGVGLALATLWLRGPAHGLSPATADEYLDSFHEGRAPRADRLRSCSRSAAPCPARTSR